MKHDALLMSAAAVVILFTSASPADARPVTAADLAEKIICWDDGGVQAFSVDGKTASRQFANGKWSVGANGVRVDLPDGGGANIDFEIHPDGTFAYQYSDIGGTHKGSGKICKGKPQRLADLAGKKICWGGNIVETDYPGGKEIDSEIGEGIYLPNDEGVLSNFTQKFAKYDEVFKGVILEDLDDGRVSFVGAAPGYDYGLGVGEYCK